MMRSAVVVGFVVATLSSSASVRLSAQAREVVAYAGVVPSGTLKPHGRLESGALAGVGIEWRRCQLFSMRWGLGGLRVNAVSGNDLTGVQPSFTVLLGPSADSRTFRPRLAGNVATMLTSEIGSPLYLGAGVAAGVTHRRGVFVELANEVYAHEGTRLRMWNVRAGWSWRVGGSPRDVCSA